MNPPPPPVEETYGLPPEASHLIRKLRAMTPEQRATIFSTLKESK